MAISQSQSDSEINQSALAGLARFSSALLWCCALRLCASGVIFQSHLHPSIHPSTLATLCHPSVRPLAVAAVRQPASRASRAQYRPAQYRQPFLPLPVSIWPGPYLDIFLRSCSALLPEILRLAVPGPKPHIGHCIIATHHLHSLSSFASALACSALTAACIQHTTAIPYLRLPPSLSPKAL